LFNESSDFRLDAEYHKKENIERNSALNKKGYSQIGEFAYVTDGIHTSIDYCEYSGINLFSATTPRENYFDLSRGAYISEKAHKENPRTALQEDDIIISTVGTIGNCAVVNKSVLPANSDRHVGIVRIRNDKFYPRFVSTFLLTKYGRFQTLRESTGNVQLNLFLYKIRELKIPNLSKEFQKVIEKVVIDSDIQIRISQQKYSQAENLLISELGLENFNPSNKKVSIKTLKESFLRTGRLDSEYYQPKYDEILNKITKYGCSEFTNFVDSYTTGYPYSSDSYVEKDGIALIKISNINNFKLDISSASLIPKNDIGLSAENVVQKNDILVSMSGTIGNSCIVQDDIKAVVNQRIMKIKSKNINPVVFSLIINSMIGKNQLERIQTGGVQANISPKDILKIQIPCIKTSVQDEIAGYIKQSMEYSKKAKELLEISTKSVEIAIDKDEQTAHNFLEQNRTEQNRTEQNRTEQNRTER